MRHKHADLIIAWANGAEIQKERKHFSDTPAFWEDDHNPTWRKEDNYRLKPKTKTIRYKRYLCRENGNIVVRTICQSSHYGEAVDYSVKWIDTEWQEIEVDEP